MQYVFQCFNHSPHEEYVEGSVATRLAPLYAVKKFDSLNFYEIRIHRTEFVGVDIPIDVVNKVEVTSQEDLFNALENGYPYITLSDDVRDPLIVTQDTMDVKKSLILDLNGKKLERISRNPMLNAKEGSYEYAGTTESANTMQITIYGFKHNIRTAMGIAENETINADKVLSGLESAPFYATIKMLGGSLDINCSGTAYQGKEAKDLTVADYQAFGTGCFITYFGVEAASCVQFTGGEMKISTSGVLATINPSLIPKGKGKPLSSEGRSICVHNNGRNESGQMQANDEQRRLLQRIKYRSNLYVFCSLRQIEKTDSPAAAIAGVSFFVILAKCEFCGAKCLRTKVKVDIISDGIDCKR